MNVLIVEDEKSSFDLVEVKYSSKAKITQAMNNFEKRYDHVNKKIVITKDLIKYEDGVYYIPAMILPFINIQK